MRPTGLINKYTTMSMLNEMRWATDRPQFGEDLFEESARGWHELQLWPGIPGATLGRAVERCEYLTKNYFSRMKNSTVLIMTLGLNEVWKDNKSDLCLNPPPSYGSTKRDAERYVLEIADVSRSVSDLEQIRDSIKQISPDIRIIVTVSPVPMNETFSGRDVAVANLRSKSTLRAAAEQFAECHADVDYFPSYDAITLAPRAMAYVEDCQHVSDCVVGSIVKKFLNLYVGIDGELPDFTEFGYFAANPDVEEAVRLGQIGSGFEHWTSVGQKENRLTKPGP